MADNTSTTALIESLREGASSLYGKDFLLTWDHGVITLKAVLAAAQVLERAYKQGKSARYFDSGLAISIFRDKSTRTRFAYASAASLLGLNLQELDETKTQIAHGETVRETANMISFMARAIGIRDDMFIHEGHRYMVDVANALDEGHKEGVLPFRPALVNLQCDLDHPTQSMADLLHLVATYGGLDKLKGKKLAMSWAYSPSYGKPLSVPQGVITLMTRFGIDVTLAHPEGYDLLPETLEIARRHAHDSGAQFKTTHSMEEAFADADIVYPKSWAPFAIMEERTRLLQSGDAKKLDLLEKECLNNNARFKNWECTDTLMQRTKGASALYMHCLPADISGVSCKAGEVAAAVFERYRIRTYQEAAHKPYVIAAMILLSRCNDVPGFLGRVMK
ncbi:MAG: knotted carbamoyltransferase YgeW [Deltaproteobacteria bacterium]|nr:knotted carbamoyltransferase YgeW [Deltaproteobacteria bacterium]